MNLYDLENSKNSRKSGISKKKETEFHAKLDTLVHDTFGKRKEELEEANPHNFDSDVDYYAAQNAPAKPRYRGTSSPGVNQDDEAYFREIFRKKRLAAQQAEKDKESGVAEGGYPEVDHIPGKRGIGLDSAKPRDTYVATFHASKEKEAHEFAKKNGHIVKKHVYPKSANNSQPHEFQVHKNEQGMAEASFDYTMKDMGNDYAGFPSNHSLKHKFLAKIKPEKQQLYKDKMNNMHEFDQLFQLFKVAKQRGDIIEQGVAEASIPYALSAANYNAEFERQSKNRTSSMPAGGGYRGRVELDVESREDYIGTGQALKKAAAAAGQKIDFGFSNGVMTVFSDSMDSDTLDQFIDDTLEQGVAEGDDGFDTHIVLVTVSDPGHQAVTQRGELKQRRCRVRADDRESAINKAVNWYRKQGFKVHDHHYVGAIRSGSTPHNDSGLNELSNELLGRYKKELGVRAGAADAAGDYDKGHELFKKINRATIRQGDNDERRHEQEKQNEMMETRLNMMRKAGYDL